MFRYVVIVIIFIVMAGLGVLFYFMFGPWAAIGIKEEEETQLAEAARRLVEKRDISMATEDKQLEVYSMWLDIKGSIDKVRLEPRQKDTIDTEFTRTYEIIGFKGTAVMSAKGAREQAARDIKSADEAGKKIEEKKRERDGFVSEYGKKWDVTLMRPGASQNFEVKFTD
jgi:hypothetical protein